VLSRLMILPPVQHVVGCFASMMGGVITLTALSGHHVLQRIPGKDSEMKERKPELEPEIMEAFRHDLVQELEELIESGALTELNPVWCHNVLAEATGPDLMAMVLVCARQYDRMRMEQGHMIKAKVYVRGKGKK
jgi:hypothetical protein